MKVVIKKKLPHGSIPFSKIRDVDTRDVVMKLNENVESIKRQLEVAQGALIGQGGGMATCGWVNNRFETLWGEKIAGDIEFSGDVSFSESPVLALKKAVGAYKIIENSANLNSSDYVEYLTYNSGDANAVSAYTNCPTLYPFVMISIDVVGKSVSESGVVIVRMILDSNAEMYIQRIVRSTDNGNLVYYNWKKATFT